MPTKPTRTAAQLQDLIQTCIDDVPELKGAGTDVQGGSIVWRDPGFGGYNWTVQTVRNLDNHQPAIARIIRQLQAQFDLEV